ncbi:MAG: YggS family pyridoxal phosphate-dependent enzyme [Mariprofundales bacterium]|nr:YggS family pyridoxal phosphate-dependent enzyme [Mariprofundales bacterium]
MEQLLQRYHKIRREADSYRAELICVSKYASDRAVEALIAAGVRDFGESRPQQLRDRAQRWPECRWYMIGPLQRNKAKYIARYAAGWVSVESLECAEEVVRRRDDMVPPLEVMLQINCFGLTRQHGVAESAALELYKQLRHLPQLQVVGLMAMVPPGEDVTLCVQMLKRLKAEVATPSMRHICVGMSHDYHQALAAGSTVIRVGSALFGATH